jgi:hypothetical protein
VRDEQALANALVRLAADPELRRCLSAAAVVRPVRTWDAYATELCARLALETGSGTAGSASVEPSGWPGVLGPGEPLEGWPQHGAERVALTGLLIGRRPRCSITIGTSGAGSLALVQQYSRVVFSIDATPPAGYQAPGSTNLSVLTGPRGMVLPILLRELESADIPLEFVLIEGDANPDGMTNDIERLLEYTPREPLFVVLHGRFDPARRRAMLNAHWERSPYLQWVDVDFIPGGIVDPDGRVSPDTRCGLALAYFAPRRRRGELRVGASGPLIYDRRQPLPSQRGDS